MPISDGYANGILNHLFGGSAQAQPTEWHIALLVGGVEVSIGGYSRVSYTGTWIVGAREVKNLGIIDMGTPSPSWGDINGVRVYDQDDNLIMTGTLDPAIPTQADIPVIFYTNELSLTIV